VGNNYARGGEATMGRSLRVDHYSSGHEKFADSFNDLHNLSQIIERSSSRSMTVDSLVGRSDAERSKRSSLDAISLEQ
jgi:hypothetical protein